jgi:hypothetical protein
MPLRNAEAMAHYEETIRRKVRLDRIARFISPELRVRLQDVFGAHDIAVWGSVAGPMNRAFFDRMSEGDDLLIVEGDAIKLIGKIAAKVVHADLSRELWQPLGRGEARPWELIYFIANPKELNVPFAEFCNLFGYAANYQLRGFTAVSEENLGGFYEKYDDLYSVLIRIQRGERAAEKLYPSIPTVAREEIAKEQVLSEIHADDVDQVLRSDLVSDHVKMQWKLASLGLKAGERIWVPAGDQAKLRALYQFEAFDSKFTTGIDLPHSYVENIDVVWKQEFRIDAAYEIENSTAIYSGLLRFADLMILAPNTLYPMFIVAPTERKNRVREQLTRPTFRQFNLCDKVRFLSYDVVDEIDRFFAGRSTGLNVDLITGKAEKVC